jgi:uncharacterized protein YggE
MRAIRIAAAAALVLAAAAFAGVAQPESASGQAEQSADQTITATGLGSVETTPDRAELSFGVERQAQNARQALVAASAAIARVVEAVRAQGIAPADIQTQQISIGPNYAEDGRRIVGYSATASVSVRLNDLGRAGALIDEAVEAGANQVYGPSLSASDSDERYREALRRAVADARTKAQALASAAGVSLGQVVALTEGGSAQPVPVAADTTRAEAAQIEPGTQRIEASVSVSFAIQ